MAKSTTTPEAEGTNPQAAPEGQPGGGDEPRTFTQDDVDRIVRERLARAKSTPPADYEDLKAKAARLDEIEEANKSDLQKANDAASRARERADEWKAKYEALSAEQERARQVARMAAQYKVDAGTLSRMAGDVEDNAKYLAGLEAARPKHGDLPDGGEQTVAAGSVDEALRGVRSYGERIRIRKEYLKEHDRG